MIAIDDFGTGYSSLAYLRQFPVDVLKIDGSFVAEMDGSPERAALVHTLVELGRILGLITLAEGIEEAVQLVASPRALRPGPGLHVLQAGHGRGRRDHPRPVPPRRTAPGPGSRSRHHPPLTASGSGHGFGPRGTGGT